MTSLPGLVIYFASAFLVFFVFLVCMGLLIKAFVNNWFIETANGIYQKVRRNRDNVVGILIIIGLLVLSVAIYYVVKKYNLNGAF